MNAKANFLAANLRPGELYAGLMLDVEGPDYHLISLPEEVADVSWSGAQDFALVVGGQLPTRREQALLYANLSHEFKAYWYWSGERPAAYSSCAWNQSFLDGCQSYSNETTPLCARAVRRIYIEQEGE